MHGGFQVGRISSWSDQFFIAAQQPEATKCINNSRRFRSREDQCYCSVEI